MSSEKWWYFTYIYSGLFMGVSKNGLLCPFTWIVHPSLRLIHFCLLLVLFRVGLWQTVFHCHFMKFYLLQQWCKLYKGHILGYESHIRIWHMYFSCILVHMIGEKSLCYLWFGNHIHCLVPIYPIFLSIFLSNFFSHQSEKFSLFPFFQQVCISLYVIS